jgi:antitoxin component YwqK of YwqJK toxin-antitoxin module
VHRYGVPVSAEDWSAGGNHGQIVTTLANGVVVTKSYNSGILDGETTYSYSHSSAIEKVESYMNGVLQKEMSYYISGAPKQEVLYNSPQNRTTSSWYESGALKSKEQMQGNLLFQAAYYGQNNQMDSQVANYSGTRTRRDDYGQLISVDTIEKGLITLRSTYHPNGAPKEVIPYANGEIHGQVKSYFPAGEPQAIEEWNNGLQAGLTTEYLNGEKITDCNYANGKKHGIERRYRDGKVVVQEDSWVNGQKQGPCTSYVGNQNKTDWYWQGKQISKANYDLIMGQGTKKNIWNNGN